MRPIRKYLRISDCNSARILEVLLFTNQLEQELQSLKAGPSWLLTLTQKQDVMNFLERRRNVTNDSRIQVSLVESIHFVASILDPCNCPEKFDEHATMFHKYAEPYGKSTGEVEAEMFAESLNCKYS